MPTMMTNVNGEPLSPESLRMLDYLRERAAALDPMEIHGRVRAAMSELDQALQGVGETEARAHPLEGEWSIAQVVDHIAQTQIRAADELRHLLSGRRPPAPPVYEALTSGAALWAPWAELLDGLCSANEEMNAQLAATTGAEAARVTGSTATARTILLANRRAPDGRVAPETVRRRAGLEGVRAGAAPAPARPPHAGQEPPRSAPRPRAAVAPRVRRLSRRPRPGRTPGSGSRGPPHSPRGRRRSVPPALSYR